MSNEVNLEKMVENKDDNFGDIENQNIETIAKLIMSESDIIFINNARPFYNNATSSYNNTIIIDNILENREMHCIDVDERIRNMQIREHNKKKYCNTCCSPKCVQCICRIYLNACCLSIIIVIVCFVIYEVNIR